MSKYRPRLVLDADMKYGHLVNIKNLAIAGNVKLLKKELKLLRRE